MIKATDFKGRVLRNGELVPIQALKLSVSRPEEPEAYKGRLILPYPPSVNRYLGFSFKSNRFFKTKEGKDYDVALRRICDGLGLKPLVGDVIFTMHLYRPRKIGDVHNYGKQLADTLQGYLYEDDKQIVEFHAYRHDDAQNPRVEVIVNPL